MQQASQRLPFRFFHQQDGHQSALASAQVGHRAGDVVNSQARTEFFWKFDVAYELEALRGVGAEDSDRLTLSSGTGHVELKTSTKSPPHPESKAA